jgi:chromosomal replication initiator protein
VLGFVVPAPRLPDEPVAVSVADVVKATVAALRQDYGALVGKGRQQSVVYARHVGMYVARKLTGASYPEIGRAFGDRDHTTVMHADRKMTYLVNSGDNRAIMSVSAVESEVSRGR